MNETQTTYELGNSHPAIVKLKEGRVTDITTGELTHPRVIHFYNKQRLLYDSLGEEWYREFFEELAKIDNPLGLGSELRILEEGYKAHLVEQGYSVQEASEKAHILSKTGGKVWYRMRTNFDGIEEIHRRRMDYINALGEYLHKNPYVRSTVDLMLIIKDVAAGTDGDNSDIDLAFSLKVNDTLGARTVADYLLAPTIRNFVARNRPPPKTADLDWKEQVYSTQWIQSVVDKPSEDIIFNGVRTDTYTKRFLAENVFGSSNDFTASIPVYPISNKQLFNELVLKFAKSQVDSQSRLSAELPPDGLEFRLNARKIGGPNLRRSLSNGDV